MKERDRPTRLVDQPPEGTSAPLATAPLATMIRSALRAPEDKVPQVKWRVRSTLRRQDEWRRRALRVAFVGALVFLTGGVVGAVVQPFLASRAQRKLDVPAETHAAQPAARGARKRTPTPPPASADPATSPEEIPAVPATTTPEALPASLPAPERASALPAQRLPVVRRVASVAPQAAESGIPTRAATESPPVSADLLVPLSAPSPHDLAPAPTPVAAPGEQLLVASALRRLRTAHDPVSALAALDDYASRFPRGVLAPEAARLRTEALLMLGRKNAALDELDKASPAEQPSNEERLVLRGELRAAAGRWQEALEDFEVVLRTHAAVQDRAGVADDAGSRARLERALWGRASARSHLGDDAGARADLRECLRRFPSGRFAAESARLLGERR